MASVTSEHLANVKDMFTTCFGYSPYEVQTQVIAEAFYTKTDQVVVQATGGGKSAIPLGVLRMAGGVGVVVVPLQTIGSNQASSAQKMCGDITAYHWDEMAPREKAKLLSDLSKLTSVKSTRIMLYVSPQSLEGKDNHLVAGLDELLDKSLLTVMGVDEMHRVPLDAPAFRQAFGKLKKKLFAKRTRSPKPPPAVCMTATLTKDLLEEFESLTGITEYTRTWGTTERPNISLKVSFSDLTIHPLKDLIQRHRGGGVKRKAIIYTNHSSRVAKLNDGARKVLADKEDAALLKGKTGGMQKSYLIDAFCADGQVFKHINPTVMIATSAANCGIDCSSCGGVGREGPPPHMVDWLQEMGRIRARDTNYPYEYLIAMSGGTWANLVLRIFQKRPEDEYDSPGLAKRKKEEKKRQDCALQKAMEVLLVSRQCVHIDLAEHGAEPGTPAVAREPCKTNCWKCNKKLLALTDLKPNRREVEWSLRRVLRGKVPWKEVVKQFNQNSNDIWGKVNKPSAKHSHRLFLQLVAARILAYSVQEPGEKGDGKKKLKAKPKVVVEHGKSEVGGKVDDAYLDDSLWRGIIEEGEEKEQEES